MVVLHTVARIAMVNRRPLLPCRTLAVAQLFDSEFSRHSHLDASRWQAMVLVMEG
jgi:hypothetical protein